MPAPLTFFDTGRSFAPYYQAHIQPQITIFEAARKQALAATRTRITIAVPVALATSALAGYFGFYKTPDFDPSIYFIGGVFLFSALFAWCSKPVQDFKQSIKDKIFPLIFGFFEGNFKHTTDSPIGVSDLEPSNLIPTYDTEHRGDYVSGQYKGVLLELLETKLTETQGTGKNRRTVTVFKGLFVRLAAPKKFKGRTLIKKDQGFMNWATNSLSAMKRVRLEDPLFEKKFEVFADDQVEARYLLTTSFMDRLLKLVDLFQAKGLECSFYNSCLLIKIPTSKNYFETSSIRKPVTFVDDINTILEEMHTIFSIIETLKLNERTGL